MDRDLKIAKIAEQVERVQVTLGSPKDPKQRSIHATEMTEALEMFLVPDVEQGITNLIRTWESAKWPMPSQVIRAVREVRSLRVVQLPPSEQPQIDPQAVCKCGARPRHALLSVISAETGEESFVHRIIAPCNAKWHRARGQGFVPIPDNFAGWVDEVLAQGQPQQ